MINNDISEWEEVAIFAKKKIEEAEKKAYKKGFADGLKFAATPEDNKYFMMFLDSLEYANHKDI